MQGFFGNSISERLSTTPEGFLICQQARLCRSGWQRYRANELRLPDGGFELVQVFRPVEEVLSPSFLASLEGKCVTDGHPERDWVSSSNSKFYCAGHVQHVRKGPTLANGDVAIVGDLIVTDESLIRKIEQGRREISVGYSYELSRNADDKTIYMMSDLVANHIAVVEKGRAGPEIKIMDHAPEQGRPCHCPRELSRLVACDDDAEVKAINFEAAAKRFLGRNIMEMRNR
jgi:hypothetical protein